MCKSILVLYSYEYSGTNLSNLAGCLVFYWYYFMEVCPLSFGVLPVCCLVGGSKKGLVESMTHSALIALCAFCCCCCWHRESFSIRFLDPGLRQSITRCNMCCIKGPKKGAGTTYVNICACCWCLYHGVALCSRSSGGRITFKLVEEISLLSFCRTTPYQLKALTSWKEKQLSDFLITVNRWTERDRLDHVMWHMLCDFSVIVVFVFMDRKRQTGSCDVTYTMWLLCHRCLCLHGQKETDWIMWCDICYMTSLSSLSLSSLLFTVFLESCFIHMSYTWVCVIMHVVPSAGRTAS